MQLWGGRVGKTGGRCSPTELLHLITSSIWSEAQDNQSSKESTSEAEDGGLSLAQADGVHWSFEERGQDPVGFSYTIPHQQKMGESNFNIWNSVLNKRTDPA